MTRMTQMTEEPCDDDFLRMFEHAACAGSLRYWARELPDAAEGLQADADYHSGRAVTLLAELMSRTVWTPPGHAYTPPLERPG